MPADSTQGVSTDISNDPFISKLRESLSAQSGIISSADSNIESSIKDAISGVNKANESSKAATESAYNREIGYTAEKNAASEATFVDSQRGYATNTAAFRSLKEYNEKSIRDLEQRKQELLMSGDAAAASKVSELVLKKLEFEDKAAQQTFNNLLSLGNFSIQQKQVENQTRAQDFSESSAVSAIALKYGLEVKPGDTIESITTKAMPFASAAQKLELEKTRAEITRYKAETQKALNDISSNKPLDETSISALARAYMTNPGAVTGVVKNTAQLGQILSKVGELTTADYKDKIASGKTAGVSKSAMINNVNSDGGLSPTQKAELLTEIEKTYGADSAQSSSSGGLSGISDWFAQNVLGEPARR